MSETPTGSGAETKRSASAMEVYAVPEGQKISLGAPSLLALPNGKLLVAFDQTGPDVKGLGGKRGHDAKRNRWMQGRVMASNDGGGSWQLAATYPFRRASLFRDGGDIYLLGEASGGLVLMRSPDGGASWSAPLEVTGDLDLWLSPTTILLEGGQWLFPCQTPSGGGMGLMVWRAARGASLMNRKAWTASPVSKPLSELVPVVPDAGLGLPAGGIRPAWRDPILIKVSDARHPWRAEGVVHVVGATASGRQHWSAVLSLSVQDGVPVVPQTPDGHPWAWIPLPGGHDKFDLISDETSRQYWLVGSQGGPGLPLGHEAASEEGLHRIGLWSSGNLVDWQFAGTVLAGGEGPSGIRCDPSLAVGGADLLIACRAGGAHSRNARESTRILCSRVPQFRAKNV